MKTYLLSPTLLKTWNRHWIVGTSDFLRLASKTVMFFFFYTIFRQLCITLQWIESSFSLTSYSYFSYYRPWRKPQRGKRDFFFPSGYEVLISKIGSHLNVFQTQVHTPGSRSVSRRANRSRQVYRQPQVYCFEQNQKIYRLQ